MGKGVWVGDGGWWPSEDDARSIPRRPNGHPPPNDLARTDPTLAGHPQGGPHPTKHIRTVVLDHHRPVCVLSCLSTTRPGRVSPMAARRGCTRLLC